MLYLAFTLENDQKQKLLSAVTYFKQNATCLQYEDISALHITLKKVADESNHKDIIRLMNLWKEQYSQNKPIHVQASSFNHFNNIYWIGIDNSLRLYQIKNEFEELAKIHGVNILKDEFEYTPHITLAFNVQEIKEGFNPKFLQPVDLELKSIALWGYDHKIRNVHLSNTLHIIPL